MTTTAFALRTTKLTKHFGGVQAVHELDLNVADGAIHGVLGPNGSGKTTFFNLISGITTPDRGEVVLFGNNVTGLPAHKMAKLGLARTFQNLRLFAGMTVLENVVTGGYLRTEANLFDSALHTPRHHHTEQKLRKLADELLEFVSLTERKTMIASQLPYGAARRLEIARALMTHPKVLLLDEPAAGMNPQETEELTKLIRRIRDRDITILVIEHHVKLMLSLCNTVTVLDHGEKIAEGLPDEIVKHPKVIEAYLGTAEVTQ